MASETETLPLDNHNEWAKWSNYKFGLNTIPNISIAKTPPKGLKWKNGPINFQEQSVPEDEFKEWIEKGMFGGGLAIIMGPIRRGKYKG